MDARMASSPDAMSAMPKPVRLKDPAAALGQAVAYLMTKRAFALQPFGVWAKVLVGQINRGHYFLMHDGQRMVGFAGWARVKEKTAEDWLADRSDFSFAQSNEGDCLVINAWAADSTAIHRLMVDHFRILGGGQKRLYFKRFYENGTVKRSRLPVNRFVSSHLARRMAGVRQRTSDPGAPE
jgi:hemolysin-activating ACP:hemolysin acyltransferase